MSIPTSKDGAQATAPPARSEPAIAHHLASLLLKKGKGDGSAQQQLKVLQQRNLQGFLALLATKWKLVSPGLSPVKTGNESVYG